MTESNSPEGPTAAEREPRSMDRKRFLAALFGVPAILSLGSGATTKVEAQRGGGEAGVPGGAGGGSAPPAAETVEQRVDRILREYDAQGIHRTGTEGDARCARWLAEEARKLGAETELEAMPFNRIDVLECYAEIGGQRIDGVPLFDAPLTDAAGVTGRLAAAGPGRSDELGFWLDAMPDAAGGRDFIAYRRSTAQRALVAVTGGERYRLDPGLALLNAESYREPFGAPVVQVSSEQAAGVKGAAGTEARVVCHAERREVEAWNTLATVPGRDPSLAPLGVMTPRSGWWQCASERGGGVAVWLEILAAVAAARPQRTVLFVASTGHELGHYGLRHYLASRAELVAGARAWVHLGANFVTSIRPSVRMQFSDQELRSLAIAALARHGLAPDVETPVGQRPIGEARNVSDGGRYISITGFNGRFHQPADRYPEAVDLPKAIAFARAYAEIALALAAA